MVFVQLFAGMDEAVVLAGEEVPRPAGMDASFGLQRVPAGALVAVHGHFHDGLHIPDGGHIVGQVGTDGNELDTAPKVHPEMNLHLHIRYQSHHLLEIVADVHYLHTDCVFGVGQLHDGHKGNSGIAG